MDVITRQSFSVIYNLDNREIPSIKINESQLFLLLIDPLGNEITEHERYFNFMVKFWKIEIPSEYSQNTNNTSDKKGTSLNKIIIEDLPLRNCSSLNYSKFSSIYETFSKIYFSGVCIDFSNLTDPLFGKYGGIEGQSTLNIYIRKCLNSTIANKTNCFPEDVIDKKLSQLFLNVGVIENDVDSNNFSNPISEFYKNDLLPISSTVFKNYFKDINSVKFRSDNGFLLKNEQSYQSYRTDRIVESVDLRGKNTLFPGTFSQVTFRCSGKTENFDRSYLKAPAIFASFGGILQAIILIGKSFVYIYSKNSMVNYLIYHIFDIEEVNNVLKNDQRPLTTNKFFTKNFTDPKSAFINNDRNQKKIPALITENLNQNELQNNHLIKRNFNLNNDKKDMKMDKINVIQESNDIQINNYFTPIIKENKNIRSRKIEDSDRYQEVQENEDIKRIGNHSAAANNNNDIRNNLKINSSNQCILNKNILDSICLNQINIDKEQ